MMCILSIPKQERRDLAERLKTANEINQNLENKLRNAKGDDVQNMMKKIREANAADMAKFQKVSIMHV